MSVGINLSNQIPNLSFVKKQASDKVNITPTNLTREVVSVPVKTDKTTEVFESSPAVNLTQRQTETLIQLQELQDSTTLQIQPQKKDEIDFNGVPRLSWLIGRDNGLHVDYVEGLSRGATWMEKFREIVERTKNDTIISKEDWQTIEYSIKGFKGGLASQQKYRAETNDPIVHKVIDYIMPKTQQRLDLLKQFLASKEKPIELETVQTESFILKNLDIKTDTNPQQLVSSNRETTELLDFLAKDLRWYKWYLEDEKESFISFYPLKSKQLSKSGNKPTIVETGTMNKLEAEEVQTRLADFFVEKNINSLKIASYSHYEFARYVSLLSDETKSAKVSSPYETMLWQTLKDKAMKGYEAEFINRIEEMYSGEQEAKVVAINGEVMKEIEMLQK